MNFGQESPPPGIWKADGTGLSNGDGKGDDPVSVVDVGLSVDLVIVVEDLLSLVWLSSFDESSLFPLLFILILSSGIWFVDGIVIAVTTAVFASSNAAENVGVSSDAGVVIFGAIKSFSAMAGDPNVAATASITIGKNVRGSNRRWLRLAIRSVEVPAKSILNDIFETFGTLGRFGT